MKNRGWVLAAAAVSGLLLAVIIGLFVRQGMENTYTASEHLAKAQKESGAAGQDAGTGAERDFASGSAEPEAVRAENHEEQADGAGNGENTEETGTAVGESREEPAAEEPVRLIFAGDVYLSDHVLAAYEAAGGIRGVLDETLADVIGSGDLFMVNQEFPFSSRGTPAPDKQYTFRLPPERVSLLEEMDIDLVTLANNHALDYGTEALLDTCQTLDAAGILRVGAGENIDEAKRPVIWETKGKKIGFLGATRVIPETSWNASAQTPGMLATYDPALLLEEIRRTRTLCDFLVVYVHWGIEREEHPEEYQRVLGQQYIDAGADLVIGSHPHVLQGLEYYKGKPIVYSLGNFVFGSSIPRTALLTVVWDGEESSLSLTPAVSSGGFTRAVTDAGEKDAFYQYMTDISYGVQVSEAGISPVSPGT